MQQDSICMNKFGILSLKVPHYLGLFLFCDLVFVSVNSIKGNCWPHNKNTLICYVATNYLQLFANTFFSGLWNHYKNYSECGCIYYIKNYWIGCWRERKKSFLLQAHWFIKFPEDDQSIPIETSSWNQRFFSGSPQLIRDSHYMVLPQTFLHHISTMQSFKFDLSLYMYQPKYFNLKCCPKSNG